ncbi:MAG: hypothetical protein ACJ0HE_01980 [Anaerolineales bacterium]
MLNRTQLIRLIEASLSARRPDYARKLSRAWLQVWPEDFTVNLLQSKSLISENKKHEAFTILKKLAVIDPEQVSVHEMLANIARDIGENEVLALSEGLTRMLLGQSLPRIPWLVATRESYTAITNLQWDNASKAAEHALQSNPNSPLPALLLIKSHWFSGKAELAFPLAQGFYDRWPQCIAINLCLAESLLRTGDYTRGVELLHDVVHLDPAREVVDRYWHDDHAYRPIWPPEPRIEQPAPIPTHVASTLGINQIGDGQHVAIGDITLPETINLPVNNHEVIVNSRKEQHSTQTHNNNLTRSLNETKVNHFGGRTVNSTKQYDTNTFDADKNESANGQQLLATKLEADSNPADNTQKPTLSKYNVASDDTNITNSNEDLVEIQNDINPVTTNSHSNNSKQYPNSNKLTKNHPVHIIITCARPLVDQFGTSGAEKILTLTRLLAETTTKRTGRECLVVLPDVSASISQFQLSAINGQDATAIKNVVKAISSNLNIHNKQIGSTLLIGGDNIVPFHRLPNPTDDHDEDVLSDNPYGTDDDNYFVPKWPVGRLPSHTGDNPSILANLIQSTINAHTEPTLQIPLFFRWLRWLIPSWQPGASKQNNLGYSADIWLDASLEVFDVIGRRKDLLSSPPIEAKNIPIERLSQISDLLYCNLHGLEDTAEWFGESISFDGQAPQYPVALRPSDITHGQAPSIVFTEACYGANIIKKQSAEDALCLHFLQSGSRAVVGSTRIAYGAVGTPLVGADLVGRFFWHHLRGGLQIGEALRRSKIGLAQTMQSRQGFLDGEDQKALLSFVLYGDPLLRDPRMLPTPTISLPKSKPVPVANLHAACAKSHNACAKALGTPEALQQVRAMVSHYLPGMETGEFAVRKTELVSRSATTHINHSKTISSDLEQFVYSTKRTLDLANYKKQQYAHATVNKDGQIIKFAVSR